MRTLLMAAMLLMLVTAIAACGGGNGNNAAEPAEPAVEQEEDVQEEALAAGDPVVGEEVFSTTCVACHGPAGEGVEGLGKDMTTSEFIAGLSDAELLAFVKQGRPPGDELNTTGVDMPPKGGNPAMTDEDIMHVIAYMRSIQK